MAKLNKTELFILILILLYAVVAFFLYSRMPETIATHWNFNGIADGFTPKLWGVMIMPVFFVIIFFVYALFSRSDLFKNANLKKQLDVTIILAMSFLFYISILSLIYNTGIHFNFSYFIIPATSVLFIVLGIILMKIKKRNLFFGIRTPWTLIDDEVWIKTHKLGGWLFIIIGITTLIALVYMKYFTIIFFSEIVGSLIIIFLYSYVIYKKK
ncbi:MAG TPA: SdpI family protein [Candidatus Diapherotrites archaeon]|jgi:uncharacterized membrane protein|nr:SdpI family protein [Candidatus Diapherotrites archaeon]